MFPTTIRYGGMAIAYNVSTSIFGGTAPLLSTWLVQKTGNLYMPAYYLMLAAAVGFVATLFARESAGEPLDGSPPAVETRAEAHELVAELRQEAR